MVMRKDPTEFRERFKAYKNGKKPYQNGKIIIGSGVDMKDDNTFTDDYTKAFDDLIVTPQGPRVKPGQLYKYQEPWDDEKFINAMTVGGLNNLSPSQWARRLYDLQNGQLTVDSWLNGNNGVVPNQYAKEHPVMSAAANMLFDFWAAGGNSITKNASKVVKHAVDTKRVPFKQTPYIVQEVQGTRYPAQITLNDVSDYDNIGSNISLIDNRGSDFVANRMAGIRPAKVVRVDNTSPKPHKGIVNEDGTVNIREVVEKMNDFYSMEPRATNYKYIYNSDSHGNRTNLFQHINDVVKSAQKIPIPTGYTRKDLVEAALYHDIGKVLNSTRNHGETSVKILDRLGINVSDDVRNAVEHHMSKNMLDKDNLTRALHFADVARGIGFGEAAFRFPHLLYNRQLPKLQIKPLSVKDELKTRINPWLRRKGYDQINLNSTEEEAAEQLYDRILQHRTFERGVRDPLKINRVGEHASFNNERNARNAADYVRDLYGVSGEEALSDKFIKDRLEYAGTTVPKDPTGSGRSNLFNVSGSPAKHTHSRYSEMLGINPDKKDGLYVSTSDKVKDHYATSSNDRAGEGYMVSLPIQERRPGESMSQWMLRNDWELYNTEKLNGGPLGVASVYEDPYRLQTGRSLLSDMKESGVIKPEYRREYRNILFPGDNPSNSGNPFVRRRRDYSYNDVMGAFKNINERLDDIGIKYQFSPLDDNGAIVDPAGKMKLIGEINDILDFNKSIGPDDLIIKPDDLFDNPESLYSRYQAQAAYNDNSYQNYAMQAIPDDLYDPTEFFNGGDPTPVDGIQKLHTKKIQHMHANPLNRSWLRRIAGDYKLSNKQIDAITRLFRAGVDARKYFGADRIVKKAISDYFSNVKGHKFPATVLDKSKLRPSAEQMYTFMKERGVLPKYDIEGFNKSAVYAVSAPEKNKTKNKELTEEIYGYIVGDKGEKVVQPVEQVGYKYSKASRGGRDVGERTNNKLTRKTLRAIIPVVGMGSTLKIREKDEKK